MVSKSQLNWMGGDNGVGVGGEGFLQISWRYGWKKDTLSTQKRQSRANWEAEAQSVQKSSCQHTLCLSLVWPYINKQFRTNDVMPQLNRQN